MSMGSEIKSEFPFCRSGGLHLSTTFQRLVEWKIEPSEPVGLSGIANFWRCQLASDDGRVTSPENDVRTTVLGLMVVPCAKCVGVDRHETSLVHQDVSDPAHTCGLSLPHLYPHPPPSVLVRPGGHPLAHDGKHAAARQAADRCSPHPMKLDHAQSAAVFECEVHSFPVRHTRCKPFELSVESAFGE